VFLNLELGVIDAVEMLKKMRRGRREAAASNSNSPSVHRRED
jgi:hypothetical protein